MGGSRPALAVFAVLLTGRAPTASAGFDLDAVLKNPDVSKVAASVKDAARDAVSAAQKGDVKDVAKSLRETAEQHVAAAKDAIESIADEKNRSKDVINPAHATRVMDMVRAAADTLHKGADAMDKSGPGHVADALSEAIHDAHEVATSNSDVAKAIREKAPAAADILNSTGKKFAEAIQKETPKIADAMKDVGVTPAPPSVKGDVLDEDGDPDAASWSLPLTLFALLAAGGGVAVGYKHMKASARTPPGLLADADMGLQMRGGNLQAPSQDEVCFRQF